MKKLLFITLSLLAFGLVLVNCSKEDDEKPMTTTGLFGTWTLDHYADNGKLVEEILCSKKITYVFLKNSTYTKTVYAGEGSTRCVVALVVNGTWKDKGENQFELKPNGSDNSDLFQLVFHDNFTKFVIVHSPTYTEVYTKRQ